MPASQAPTETRLPRAVMRIAADVQARIDAKNAARTGTETQDPPPAPAPVAASPAETPPAPTPPADPRESDPVYWKQRFNVTEGMLRKERADRVAAAAAMNQQIADLQEANRALQASKPAEPIDVAAFFTPADIEKYGEEQCQVMANAAQAAAAKSVTALRAEFDARLKPIADARKQEQTDAAARAVQDFVDKLVELVPNYAVIDKSQPWLDWLTQLDEPTQLIRQDILDNHVARRNAPAVARMFKDFEKSQTPPPAPPMTPHGGAASTPTPPAPTPPAGGDGQGAPTDAEVKDYYKRAAIGRVKDDERVKFEARMKLRGAR